MTGLEEADHKELLLVSACTSSSSYYKATLQTEQTYPPACLAKNSSGDNAGSGDFTKSRPLRVMM